MKKLLLILIWILLPLCLFAQTTITHTVQRGETIESVAKKYGISVGDLQQANPSIVEYFYAGLKIVIPQKTNSQNTTQAQNSNGSHETPSSKDNAPKPDKTIKPKTSRQSSRADMDGSDFTSVALTFGSDFSKLVGMSYGIQGQYFLKSGFGATLMVGANYGLESDADIMFRVGPSYVYPITNMFYAMGTACYTLTLAKHSSNSGTVSGITIVPTVGMSFNHLKVGLNGDFYWRHGGKFGVGTYLSVGYSF